MVWRICDFRAHDEKRCALKSQSQIGRMQDIARMRTPHPLHPLIIDKESQTTRHSDFRHQGLHLRRGCASYSAPSIQSIVWPCALAMSHIAVGVIGQMALVWESESIVWEGWWVDGLDRCGV